MSPRARSVAFLLAALAAAALAASIAGGYGSTLARGYGPLRRVVVVAAALPAGRRIGAADLEEALTVRRVPARFVPPGALSSPPEALGLVPAATLPAGSYLLAAQLRPPERAKRPPLALRGGRHPVEISVSGAGALLAAGPLATGARVDVVVTSEPGRAGPGRTYVAAAAVPLLGLAPEAGDSEPGGLSVATLALTRRQALRLIAAESFARKLTLLPER
jgi:Flp pilus assembly protein CpaB